MGSSDDRSRRTAALVVLALFAAALWWLSRTDDVDGEVDVLAPVEVIEGAEVAPPEVVGGDEAATALPSGGGDEDATDDDTAPPTTTPTGALDLSVSGAFRPGEVVVVGLRRIGDAVGIPFFTMRPPRRTRVQRLEPGSYEVLLLAPVDVTGPPLARGQVSVRADAVAELSISYAPGRATLRVRLVGDVPWFDELLGEPQVRLRRPTAPNAPRDPIDEDWETLDGAEVMTIADLAPGPRVVDVAPFGIARDVALVDGGTTDVDIHLDDLAWIVARPTDATGFVYVVWGFVGDDTSFVVPQAAGEATWAAPPRPIWVRAVGEQASSDTTVVSPVARETSAVALVCDRPPPPTLAVHVTTREHEHVLGGVFVSDTEIHGPGRVLVTTTEFSRFRDVRNRRHVLERTGTYTLRHTLRLGETLVDEFRVQATRRNIETLILPRAR